MIFEQLRPLKPEPLVMVLTGLCALFGTVHGPNPKPIRTNPNQPEPTPRRLKQSLLQQGYPSLNLSSCPSQTEPRLRMLGPCSEKTWRVIQTAKLARQSGKHPNSPRFQCPRSCGTYPIPITRSWVLIVAAWMPNETQIWAMHTKM